MKLLYQLWTLLGHHPAQTGKEIAVSTVNFQTLPYSLLSLAAEKKYLELENTITTYRGDSYSRLTDTTENGENLFHLIARDHPTPIAYSGTLIFAINSGVNMKLAFITELLHKPNQQGETFFTIIKARECDISKELGPRVAVENFFRKAINPPAAPNNQLSML